MGVRGLTSYVNHKADLYYEDFQLKNSFIIIDGYSLASNLYSYSTKLNSAFGGDYDKYAKVVQKYFDLLKRCNVTPIVVCDGGYEKKKINTVKKRNLQRVFAFDKVTPSCVNYLCFPLMMRHVFREKVLELNVILVQSDFEADNEIAALAKILDAPVLSNDSDFFIFDIQYIPLSSMTFDSCEKSEEGQFYIPCQIFILENLLKGLGGLPKTMLPLLATVLGNDYIKPSQFSNFYSHLKMDKSKNTRPGQKRVRSLVSWLKEENFESALDKILKCLKKDIRRSVKRHIKYIIKGYTNLNTNLVAYLPEDIMNEIPRGNETELAKEFSKLRLSEINSESDSEAEENGLFEVDEGSLVEENEEDLSSDNLESNDFLLDNGSDTDDEELMDTGLNLKKNSSAFPSWILDEARKGNICPSINTLLLLKVYFYVPQIEDYDHPHSGAVTIPILRIIVGLLNLGQITYWSREKCRYVRNSLEPIKQTPNFQFPILNELNQLSSNERRSIFCESLHVDSQLLDELFPTEWQLYIASVVYWIKTNENPIIKPWHIHAILITLITVSVIGSKIGHFWQKKTFMNRYGSKLRVLAKRKLAKTNISVDNISEAIFAVSEDDCILAMALLIQYFHVNDNLHRHSRNFSRTSIHLCAQLQSIFELANTLNSLLLMPLKRSNLSMFYNGTFLYNFTANFKTRSNILLYVENLFSLVPSVKHLFKIVFEKLYCLIPSAPKQKIKIKKKKQKPIVHIKEVEEIISDHSNDDDFSDCNNKYSLLRKKS